MSQTLPSSIISSMASLASSTSTSASTSTPHITGFHDRSDAIFVVGIVMTTLATAFVVMRIISKTWVVRKVMWDDYITILAWLFFTALSTAVIVGSRNGLGKVGQDIQPQWVGILRKCTYTFVVFYNPATMTIKLAILLLYRRMSEVQPWFRYGTYATMLVVSLAGIVCTFLAIFQCRPISAAWRTDDSNDSEGQCIDVIALFLASAPINILTDLSILLLPLPILTSLRMEMRQKVALIATFCVGGFVTIVDVVRIAYLQQALKSERIYGDHGELNANTQFGDFTFYISLSLMWSFIEISVGLMCSCTLVLKPLVLRVMPAILRRRPERGRGLTQQDDYGLAGRSISFSPSAMDSPEKEKDRSPKSPFTAHQSPVFKQQERGRENSAASGSGSGGSNEHQNDNGVEHVERRGSSGEEEEGEDEGEIFDFAAILKQDPPQYLNNINNHRGQTTTVPNNFMASEIRPVDFDGRRTNNQNLKRSASVGHGHGTNTKLSYMHRLRAFSTSTKKSGERTVEHHTQGPTAKFFDFVNMSGNKPLTELGAMEALGPILFVSILFFLWGFSYGLIGNLNGEIEGLLGFQPHESLGLQSAYWAAYLVGPVCVGYWTLTKKGFKATFVAGLTIYSIGAMAFWPSAVLTSFPGFVVSNFMVALGLSTLETAANPFIALAGPGELSEARLLFSQAIQAIGSLASSLLSQRALFNNVDQMRLFNVQWCYLAVAIFVLILAAIFYYVPLSEATNEDLEIKAERRFDHAGITRDVKSFGISTRVVLLVTGVFVISNYVSAQESISFTWNGFIEDIKPSVDPRWMRTIGQGLFFASRILASLGCYLGIPPRYILGFCILGTFLTALIPMLVSSANGSMGTLILHMFFEGPIFPLVFAMTIRGQGRHTKSTSTALIASICGATVFPVVSYEVEKLHPNNRILALTVVCALYGSCAFFPIMLTINRNLRRWIDPKWSIKKEGDKIATHGNGYGGQEMNEFRQPNYTKTIRDDLGINTNNSINGVVGLGLNLNGGEINQVNSFSSIRGVRDFER
ncbi:hypothetical protein I302_107175 [Kwoniella bestiolae CBS 10118]|uniref:Rhodopsin domain-containing protein n=1 Tax=Kwoniella bestiolae CBS 10118 TaxID=1296100 RepID=A0A1B9FZC0_9TREE|nr:hypothetical protein I302_05559 [Kwoniella bestiolae CBS 10118]OCF24101.1 hypothetical protein I302_05559 [Kwoniella bestiolae CBS 10118]